MANLSANIGGGRPGVALPGDSSGVPANIGGGPGIFLPGDPGFQQSGLFPQQQKNIGGIPPFANIGDLLTQLFRRFQGGQQQSQGQPQLATDKAIQKKKPKAKKDSFSDPEVPADQMIRWAEALGLAVRPRKSVTGGGFSGFDIEGINTFGITRRSDFVQAFSEKQRDFRRMQTDPLNATRATDVANQVFGQKDLLNQTAQKNELEQIRNDLETEKAAFDITESLLQ